MLSICVPTVVSKAGSVNVFLDNFITLGLLQSPIADHLAYAVPVIIETFARPLAPFEPLLWSVLISQKKLNAEGRPSKLQTVLGWSINTRSLMISLPHHKILAWSSEIDRELRADSFKHHPFESLVGKLTHVTTIIPLSKCFLSQFYPLLHISKNWGTGRLSELARLDLVFWKFQST